MGVITARTVDRLPPRVAVQRGFQAAAMVDSMLQPEANWRVFSFNAHWRAGWMLGQFNTHQGCSYSAGFADHAAVIAGFDEDHPFACDYNDDINKCVLPFTSVLPQGLKDLLASREFDTGRRTLCIWSTGSWAWQCAPVMKERRDIIDAPLQYLELISGDVDALGKWIAEDYQRSDLMPSVRRMCAFEPLEEHIVAAFQSDMDYDEIVEEARRIGYPVAIRG